MAFQVMHADYRYAQGVARGMRNGGPYQKGTGKPRAFSDGNRVNVFFCEVRVRKHLIHQGNRAADMVAASEFRHNAAVGAVHVNLRVNGLREQFVLIVNERCTGFVAGTFNAENNHGLL